MSLELDDYRLDDARSLTRDQLQGDQSVELRRLEEFEEFVDDGVQLKLQDNDWITQDRFAQIVDTTSIEVHHEGEKSFDLTTFEVDEVEHHTGEDVHHVPNDVKAFEKVKTKNDMIIHGQQMDKHLFAVSTCDVRNNFTDQVTDEITRNNFCDSSVNGVKQQQLSPHDIGC
ncbi:hypothetical protein AMTR_s00049p00190760 [Amborella trichopoda]|uniref:Uncharacterized protein n=1 Tax=Amborella trichopoda TaxID=13333 RepID=W1Q0W2_AMBTC|nr:hypothetical protein AMTR_s00049p00190760 [Amborella trichopoda]